MLLKTFKHNHENVNKVIYGNNTLTKKSYLTTLIVVLFSMKIKLTFQISSGTV